ncbi:epimerase [Xanthomonas sp. XNM01]|uniref:epimerase n=1 Tax=Xanthomonas sp. XNM01 TaxID=2769289 RepID=UPI00177DCF45|nr:epimerase [Xanthomonas sp. XNM01]
MNTAAAASGPVLVFGLGYTARRIAAALVAAGVPCTGTTRAVAAVPPDDGIARLPFPADDRHALRQAAAQALVLLSSIPPDADGDPAARFLAASGIALPRLRWLGYLSSTAVYAGRDGGSVDADTPADGTDATARARLAAEAQWRALAAAQAVPLHLFRLAGIYGPGRNALVQLAQGRARWLDRPDVLFNRIHVDDIVAAVLAALAAGLPAGPHVWPLADGHPATQRAVLEHAAALSGLPMPPALAEDDPQVSPALRRFYAGSKRIDSRHARQRLGWVPRFPSYREGLAAAWADMSDGDGGSVPPATPPVAGIG